MQQSDASVMEVQGLTRLFHVGGGGPFGLGGERRYVHAVEDVSFALQRGHILALVGESGSGKSTIARLLARLDRPTSGQVRLKGCDVLSTRSRRALLEYRAEVQMIFQDPFGSLNPVKTIGHHLARPLTIHQGLHGPARDERMRALLRTVGLGPPADYIDKSPHQLSEGHAHRAAIARALPADPQALAAD